VWEAAYEPAVGLTLTAASGLTLGLGGYLVWHNQLTIGALTSFTMYLGQLIWPMFAAGWVLSLIERGRAAWQRLQPMLDAPLAIDDHGTLTQCRRPAVAAGVSYAYAEQSAPAISDITLTLQPGQTLGLVGPTGSGKSTLLRVLLRQLTPQHGSVQWSGHALDSTAAGAARRHQLGAAGVLPVLRLDCGQHRAGPPRRHARAGRTRGQLAAIHDDILLFPRL
jgi:ATP-binding cassette subfamily B protein/ATP-binding cassette subfamily C protein/ATP-binding cassette subfamily B multidrug efflux pump